MRPVDARTARLRRLRAGRLPAAEIDVFTHVTPEHLLRILEADVLGVALRADVVEDAFGADVQILLLHAEVLEVLPNTDPGTKLRDRVNELLSGLVGRQAGGVDVSRLGHHLEAVRAGPQVVPAYVDETNGVA